MAAAHLAFRACSRKGSHEAMTRANERAYLPIRECPRQTDDWLRRTSALMQLEVKQLYPFVKTG